MSTVALLSVAIPTYNRARYLALTLTELGKDLADIPPGLVEIVVSDNSSSDETPEVVAHAVAAGLAIRAVRNDQNIGSDANIAQAFNMANGRYVLILGDDDVLVDGTVRALLRHIESGSHGVICLQPYGYSNDFRTEFPGGNATERIYADSGKFLADIGQLVTLISAVVINKAVLENADARQFVGGNLVQVHLALAAALQAKTNLYVKRYSVACKRNNSGGYDFAKVFVQELWSVVDQHAKPSLSPLAIRQIERHFLIGFYPFYLLRQRLQNSGDLDATRRHFRARFEGSLLYGLWIAPILDWPRLPAIVWGALATLLGRALYGDLHRGFAFAWHRVRHAITGGSKAG